MLSEVLLWHSGLRIWCPHCCGSGSCEAWSRSLAWELPHASGEVKKKKNKKVITFMHLCGWVFVAVVVFSFLTI